MSGSGGSTGTGSGSSSGSTGSGGTGSGTTTPNYVIDLPGAITGQMINPTDLPGRIQVSITIPQVSEPDDDGGNNQGGTGQETTRTWAEYFGVDWFFKDEDGHNTKLLKTLADEGFMKPAGSADAQKLDNLIADGERIRDAGANLISDPNFMSFPKGITEDQVIGFYQALGSVAVSMIPYVGEAQDVMVLADPDATWWEKLLAQKSLELSAATGGLTPNIGGPLRAMRKMIGATKAADKAVDATRALKNGMNRADDVMDARRAANDCPDRFLRCFARDTPVVTEGGLQAIGTIEAGQRVAAYDFNAGEWVWREVTTRHDNRYHGPVVTVDLGESQIETTVYHPFWVLEGRDLEERSQPRKLQPHESEGKSLRGRWVNSHELRAGDAVYGHDGLPCVIRSISQRFEEEFLVTNLTVTDCHNYLVGDQPILVHNDADCGIDAPKNTGPEWKSRRDFQDGDSGLKDHARRHSELSPQEYLANGQLNVTQGKMLKGGGKYPDVNYWVRKIGDDQYSMTIVDKSGKILSIDTWQHGSVPMSKADILNGLKKSGVTPPKGFWERL